MALKTGFSSAEDTAPTTLRVAGPFFFWAKPIGAASRRTANKATLILFIGPPCPLDAASGSTVACIAGYFQSSSDSSSSSSSSTSPSSSSSSSSSSSADSSSRGLVLTTLRSAPHSSQLTVSPSSTSSSSTSIAPSHTGQVTMNNSSKILLLYDTFPLLQLRFGPAPDFHRAACFAWRRRVVAGTIPLSRRHRNMCARCVISCSLIIVSISRRVTFWPSNRGVIRSKKYAGLGASAAVWRQGAHVRFHAIAKIGRGETLVAGQQQAGQPVAGIEDMARGFPKRHRVRRWPEVKFSGRKVFHR